MPWSPPRFLAWRSAASACARSGLGRLEVLPVEGLEADAGADLDRPVGPRDVARQRADGGQQALHDAGRVDLAGVGQEHGELVAAQATGDVLDAQRLADHAAHVLDDAVADRVVVQLVDLAEAIEVDQQQGHVELVALGGGHVGAQLLGELQRPQEARAIVVGGAVTQLVHLRAPARELAQPLDAQAVLLQRGVPSDGVPGAAVEGADPQSGGAAVGVGDQQQGHGRLGRARCQQRLDLRAAPGQGVEQHHVGAHQGEPRQGLAQAARDLDGVAGLEQAPGPLLQAGSAMVADEQRRAGAHGGLEG